MFHNQQHQIRKSNTAIPVSYVEGKKNRPHETCSLPYGAAGNIYDQTKPAVSLVNRKCNTELYFLWFVYENNVPIYITLKLVQLCKDVTIDNRNPNKIKLSGTLVS